MEKLQAIRRQNYMERKRIQQCAAGPCDAPPPAAVMQHPPTPKPAISEPPGKPQISADERRKKIAALKVLLAHLYQLTSLFSSILHLADYTYVSATTDQAKSNSPHPLIFPSPPPPSLSISSLCQAQAEMEAAKYLKGQRKDILPPPAPPAAVKELPGIYIYPVIQ